MSRIFLWILPLCFVGLGATRPPEKISDASIVRVYSTNQPFDFIRPWQKKAPFQRRGTGSVIGENQILVTADLVTNSTFIEIERATGGEKCPATVDAIDYESNLALLTPKDSQFLSHAKPLEIDEPLEVGDRVQVVQLETNGRLVTTHAEVTTVTVGSYSLDDVALLVYRIRLPLQFRDGSFTLPAVRGNRLSGVLMRYDARTQTGDLIPPEIIRRFLSLAKTHPFPGFPRAGFSFVALRDPQLRRYSEIPESVEGVYISRVVPRSSAAEAGLQEGDVLVKVGDAQVDPDGNYDHPQHGKIPLSYLISTVFESGQTVPLTIYRKGKEEMLSLKLRAQDPLERISPNFTANLQPRYVIIGGLVFEELSRSYLREWGTNWRSEAPQRLVYLDAMQDDLPADRGRIVILSRILPSGLTIGYEGLQNLEVTKLNDRPIRRLEDLIEAEKHSVNGFHKLEFEESPGIIYLDADLIKEKEKALLQRYQISSPSYLEAL